MKIGIVLLPVEISGWEVVVLVPSGKDTKTGVVSSEEC
jgi:hypothetical protein